MQSFLQGRCAAGFARVCRAAASSGGRPCVDCPLAAAAARQLGDIEDIASPAPARAAHQQRWREPPAALESTVIIGRQRTVRLNITTDLSSEVGPPASSATPRRQQGPSRDRPPSPVPGRSGLSPRRLAARAASADRVAPQSLSAALSAVAARRRAGRGRAAHTVAEPGPVDMVPFSSTEGRRLLRDSLSAGFGESYFALAEQFEAEVSEGGTAAGVLATVLNALGVDPLSCHPSAVSSPVWKGVWRWFTEPQLADGRCGDKGGEMTFPEFACLAQRCVDKAAGAAVAVFSAAEVTEEAFRVQLKTCAASPKAFFVCAFDRGAAGVGGSGLHFAPVAAYDPQTDSALLLDPARTRTPPYWLPLRALRRAASAGGGHMVFTGGAPAPAAASAGAAPAAEELPGAVCPVFAATECCSPACAEEEAPQSPAAPEAPAAQPAGGCSAGDGVSGALSAVLHGLVHSSPARRQVAEVEAELAGNPDLRRLVLGTRMWRHVEAARRSAAAAPRFLHNLALTAVLLSCPADAFAAVGDREQVQLAGLRHVGGESEPLRAPLAAWRRRMRWLQRVPRHLSRSHAPGCGCLSPAQGHFTSVLGPAAA